MKQYMPLKPVKRGSSSGWWLTAQTVVLDVQVYIGQEGGATEHGLGERVVLGLTEKYRGSNHHVFFFLITQALQSYMSMVSNTTRFFCRLT